jgi:hypothetical protein
MAVTINPRQTLLTTLNSVNEFAIFGGIAAGATSVSTITMYRNDTGNIYGFSGIPVLTNQTVYSPNIAAAPYPVVTNTISWVNATNGAFLGGSDYSLNFLSIIQSATLFGQVLTGWVIPDSTKSASLAPPTSVSATFGTPGTLWTSPAVQCGFYRGEASKGLSALAYNSIVPNLNKRVVVPGINITFQTSISTININDLLRYRYTINVSGNIKGQMISESSVTDYYLKYSTNKVYGIEKDSLVYTGGTGQGAGRIDRILHKRTASAIEMLSRPLGS